MNGTLKRQNRNGGNGRHGGSQTAQTGRRSTNGQGAASAGHSVQSAKAAGLRYANDSKPGIRRVARGKGFSYVDPEDKPVRQEDTLERIRTLAIPPAWTDVWICPTANGHLQATGRDARVRKQYRYHPRWNESRDATKFDRMIEFARMLPRIRRRVARDLKRRGLPREKVLAAVVKLLETSLIRVGSEEYARENGSFGLTTMRRRHVDVTGSRLRFEFRGKSGVQHAVDLNDRRLAKIVKSCQELPGYEIFKYLDDDGEHQSIDSSDVNDYLRDITKQELTSKDFRTWAATVLAAQALQQAESCDSEAEDKRHVVQAVQSVAKLLGNTQAVCRKCYVHPAVIDAYLDHSMVEAMKIRGENGRSPRGLEPEEAAVLRLLQKQGKQSKGK